MTTDASLSFSELGLPENICQTLAKLGYEQPSSIQERSIGPLLEGNDLLGVAQTGTGKTAAFALPLIARMETRKVTKPVILVLTPTRELCIQVAEAFESYCDSMKKVVIAPIYGGQDMGSQVRLLRKGAHIVVGTPGRVMDHIRRKTLDLSGLSSMVLDEADEMLRMGFIDDVEWILEQTPDDHQLALFSATMPSAIKRISSKYLKDPVEVRIESATKTVDTIEQNYIEVNPGRKLAALDLVLETEEFDAVIVFARTKISAQELAQKLETRGYRASAIHGDLNQRQRELCIRQLKESVIDVVVATDVAARGIDVPRISHVVNYDIPYDGESYIHRIGRTGRAGRSGKAILFVTQRERRMLKTIERTTGQPVAAMKLPTVKTLKQIRLDRFAKQINETLAKGISDDLRECLSSIQESNDISYEDMALALTTMSQGARSLVVNENDLSMTNRRNSKLSGRSEGGNSRERGGRSESRSDSRSEHGGKHSKKSRSERANERENIPMESYRLQVGRSHSVRVGDILGAVANELGMESRYIGEIKLEENTSVIELPKGMPKELFQEFRKIRVRNYPANPELATGGRSRKRSAGDTLEKERKASSEAPAGGKRKPRKKVGAPSSRKRDTGRKNTHRGSDAE